MKYLIEINHFIFNECDMLKCKSETQKTLTIERAKLKRSNYLFKKMNQ